jgi:hypothetical protein
LSTLSFERTRARWTCEHVYGQCAVEYRLQCAWPRMDIVKVTKLCMAINMQRVRSIYRYTARRSCSWSSTSHRVLCLLLFCLHPTQNIRKTHSVLKAGCTCVVVSLDVVAVGTLTHVDVLENLDSRITFTRFSFQDSAELNNVSNAAVHSAVSGLSSRDPRGDLGVRRRTPTRRRPWTALSEISAPGKVSNSKGSMDKNSFRD